MAVNNKLQLGVINITVHPHTQDDYIELLQSASKIGAVKVRGTTYCELRHVEVDEAEGLVYCEVYKYTDIDKDAPWYNTNTLKLATEDEVKMLNIPDDYKPNAGKFSLYLYPKKHVIFYQSYYRNTEFSSKMAVNFFDNLFGVASITKKFGVVNVTHVPEKQKVSEFIDYSHKEQLSIILTRPNPDSLADVEKKLLERMNSRNVAEYKEDYKAIESKEISLDDDLKNTIRIASKNGYATTKVRLPNGAKKILSTRDYPYSYTEYFDPKEINETVMFKESVKKLIDKITDWLN
ncbi:DUF4747 family protein [Paraglaciecola chathamensis]|uniref:DUF4747 domain-containing protein n=1 Tax=Paraglaciecola agarilytica NO2 TaxID=1125747 RepID=A0ABQ0I3X3_9ALTE|nr:DUF4747 family protein [Paraglaciecola agarilytica]GAC04045.1 hypothetical protein GAGA_1187 [Paraglaciecola agarilytica NO2]